MVNESVMLQTSSMFYNQFYNPIFQIVISDNFGYRLVKHSILNTVLIFIFFLQKYENNPVDTNYQLDVIRFQLSAVMYVASAGIVYLNIYALIPYFLFRGKLSTYLIMVVLVVLIYTLLLQYGLSVIAGWLIHQLVPPEPFVWSDFIDTLILPSIFLASTTGIKVLKKWILDTIRINELEKQQLQEELNHLKSQVNPHFLFNTLNNLHALTRIDPEKASQVLLSLSDILRYQLYDSNRDKVLLSKDIENIRQLLLLEKIRRDRFEYNINIIKSINGKILPPFLFTPFVENAIKHSASANEIAMIDLNFCLQDDLLTFECFNSKPRMMEKKEVGGLGLNNIKRRLELLYPQKYILEINESIDTYYVKMIIPL